MTNLNLTGIVTLPNTTIRAYYKRAISPNLARFAVSELDRGGSKVYILWLLALEVLGLKLFGASCRNMRATATISPAIRQKTSTNILFISFCLISIEGNR